jgi:signal transduction histidine kinase/type II secretory pathway pseudopilin PulG
MSEPDAASRPAAQRGVTREEIQRDVQRTITSVVVVLAVVLALALAAVFADFQAARNLRRAEDAEARAREQLWQSQLDQARALRLTPAAGRREAALTALSNAATLRVSAELRTEAVASLALTDLQVEGPLRSFPRGLTQIVLNEEQDRYTYGSPTGHVFICRVRDGVLLQELHARDLGPGTRLPVSSLGFSPDGKKLSARFSGGALVVWELAGPRVLLASAVDATNVVIAGMSFWPDRDVMSYGDAEANGQITVHDFALGRKLQTAIRVGARTFRFRPGTMEVAITTDQRVDLSDYPLENRKRTLTAASRVFNHVWSPDGRLLAVATENGDIYLWSPDEDTHKILPGHSEPPLRLAFSPDGKLLASGSRDGTSRLWDVVQAQNIVISSEGLAGSFTPDGKRLALWRPSVGYGAWALQHSDTFTELICPKTAGGLLSMDLSPSGRWCVAAQTSGVRLWDLANGDAETFIPVSELTGARFAPDESALFICRARGLEKWTLGATNGRAVVGHETPMEIPLPGAVGARGIAISLDGRHAVVELTNLRLAILDLLSNTPPVFLAESCRTVNPRSPASPTGAGRFAISPDGRWIATGFEVGREDRPKIWDARTGALLTTLAASSSVVAFSPDGRWLGTAGAASFGIWSVGDWKLLNKFPIEEPSFTHGSMAFMRGGPEVLATRSRQQVQLRHALEAAKFADFIPPRPHSVNGLRMALDGSVFVTTSPTERMQVWRLGAMRAALAQRGLVASASVPPVARPAAPRLTRWVLLGSAAGFGLAAVFALLTLRRHRSALTGFLAAEARATARQRELEAAKVELMHSQKMQALGTLAAGIAHDFNNLLSVIRMSGKLIGRATKQDADLQENVADIEQAVLQGKNVVGSMLGYARTENEPAGPVDLGSVVEETVSLLSKEFLSGITLTLELDRHIPPVDIGRGQIDQVLLNLIVNASEAMHGKGKLKISLHLRDTLPERNFVLRPESSLRYVELAVTDSGPGLAPEILERVFEPFFTTKRSGAKVGTGLGLSLVYSVAQQERLGLSVDNAPGQGATFALIIPVRETHSSQPAGSS